MSRDISSKKTSERQPSSPRQDRTADDQREPQASSSAGSAPGASSLDTGDPAVQTPPAGQPGRPEDIYSMETNRTEAPPDAGRKDVRESPKPPASTRQTRSSRESDAGQSETANDEPRRGGAARREEHASRQDSMLNWKTLLAVAGVALVCGAAGAWATHAFTSAAQDEGGPTSSTQGGSHPSENANSSKSGGSKSSGGKKQGGADKNGEQNAGASAADIPGFTAADDAETLKKQIKRLADRIEQVDRRIDSLQAPQAETPPVVHTLHVQFADLAKEVDELAETPAELRRLEHRLSSLEQQLKTLRDAQSIDGTALESQALDSLFERDQGEVPAGSAAEERAREDFPTAASSDTKGEAADDVEDNGATMNLGIELFQKERYAQAREVFRRLQRARPNDARVWYFSALANGLITRDWDGKTKELFDKGVARERAGDPPSERIDKAFADLKSAEAREWLERFRRRANDESQADRARQEHNRRLTPESFKVP